MKAIRWIALGILSFAGLIFFYLLAALLTSIIPVNSEYKPTEDQTIDVYIQTNGVHTDLVLPYQNESCDWAMWMHPDLTKGKVKKINWIAFGWGDKGFYLETPTWAELKLSTALKALFYLSTTAMHVSYYRNMEITPGSKKIQMDKADYLKLVKFIRSSFRWKNGHAIWIPNHSYGQNDVFYEAAGRYSLFSTCNSWVNEGLKESGLKASLWTPFDFGIFWHYP